MSNHDRLQKFRFTRALPCGCCLEICVSARKETSLAKDMANQWFDGRQRRHRCDLVSTENPNGLTPLKTPYEARLTGAVDLSLARVDHRHADR